MSEFDKRAAVWVAKHVPDAGDVIEGSVEFEYDVSSYNGELDEDFDVTWTKKTTYKLNDGTPLPGGTRERRFTLTHTVTEVMKDLVEPDRVPEYPEIGSDIPPEQTGGMDGYVVGYCRHRMAGSEWRAGFRNCERCA